jgi:hypothetical protein
VFSSENTALLRLTGLFRPRLDYVKFDPGYFREELLICFVVRWEMAKNGQKMAKNGLFWHFGLKVRVS